MSGFGVTAAMTWSTLAMLTRSDRYAKIDINTDATTDMSDPLWSRKLTETGTSVESISLNSCNKETNATLII